MAKNEMYYAEINGKTVNVRALDRRLIRKFMMKADVINAQISGAGDEANIAITTKDGKTVIYKSDGRIVRN